MSINGVIERDRMGFQGSGGVGGAAESDGGGDCDEGGAGGDCKKKLKKAHDVSYWRLFPPPHRAAQPRRRLLVGARHGGAMHQDLSETR